MIQLYKKRGFSDYLNDTINFVKLAFKPFAKNYLIVCGGLLLLLAILGYFFFNAYMSFAMNAATNNFRFDEIFGGNLYLFGGLILLLVIVALLFSFLSYLYPVAFLKLYDEKNSIDISTNDVIAAMKQNFGRTFQFVILSTIFMVTLGLLVMALLVLLFITIIGIPVALIAILALMAIYNVAFYIYINDRNVGFVDAFKLAFRHVKANLWPIVGANFVIYMLIQIVSSVITFIPMMIGMGSIFTSLDSGENFDKNGFSSMMGIIMVLSIIVSYLLQNLIILCNGMVYYTMQEANQSPHIRSEIDLIGSPTSED